MTFTLTFTLTYTLTYTMTFTLTFTFHLQIDGASSRSIERHFYFSVSRVFSFPSFCCLQPGSLFLQPNDLF